MSVFLIVLNIIILVIWSKIIENKNVKLEISINIR